MKLINNYNVDAYLKAIGTSQFIRDFNRASESMDGVQNSSKKARITIGRLVGAMAGIAGAIGLFRTLRGAVDGAISRYDTLNNFPKILEQVGFSSEQSEKAINDLSDGIQGLPTRLDDVAGTAQRIGVMTKDIDGAVETTLALNNAFIASGSDSAQASRGLEQYIQMLGKGEVDLQSWRSLQETMGVALNDIAESFGYTGASAQNDLYDALKDGTVTFDDFNSRLVELSEETGGFAERAQTASGGIRTAWTNMNTAVARGITDIIGKIDEFLAGAGLGSIQDIIKRIGDTLYAGLSGIGDLIEPIGNAFIDLYNILKPYSDIITAILIAFGGFLGVSAIVGTVTKMIGGLKTAFTILWGVLKANPIGLVIGILAGLAYYFINLYKTSDTFREGVNNAFQRVKDFVMPIVQTIVDFIKTVWGAMVGWWNENSGQILETAQNIFGKVQEFVTVIVSEVVSFVMEIWGMLTEFWNENGQMIMQASENAWNFVSTIITTAVEVIWNIISGFISFLQPVWTILWEVIKVVVIGTWEAIKSIIRGAINVITGIIQFFSALFTGNWGEMWEAVKQIISGAIEFIWGWIQVSFVGRIVKAIGTFAKLLRGRISSMWETIKLIFMYAVDFVRNFVVKGFTRIRTGVSNTMGRVRDIISNLWNRILTIISNIVTKIRNTISNIFNSLRGIVSGAFGKVRNAVRDGINRAYRIVTDKVKDFFNAGRNIVTSIADGIKGAIGKVTGAIGKVTQKVRNFLPFSNAKEGALSDILNVPIVESIAKSINRGEGSAIKAMKGVTDSVYDVMPHTDIAGRVSSIHNRSQRQMRYDYNNVLDVERQPMQLNLMLGEHEFEVFVDDVTEVQNRKIRLEENF